MEWYGPTDFLKSVSDTRSFPEAANRFTVSARKILPVVAIATMCECSENTLKVTGSFSSPLAFRE